VRRSIEPCRAPRSNRENVCADAAEKFVASGIIAQRLRIMPDNLRRSVGSGLKFEALPFQSTKLQRRRALEPAIIPSRYDNEARFHPRGADHDYPERLQTRSARIRGGTACHGSGEKPISRDSRIARGAAGARVTNWYEQNAYVLSRGQQLFEAMNCVGCHAHGGGGIGPALSDATWIYGSDPAEIYGSIMYGRPNGMPAFHGRLREEEAWELAAYVRSIAGLTPKSAAPGRSDEINGPQPPSSLPRQTP
jgi:cytochrome c553